MSDYKAPVKELEFVLREMFNVSDIWGSIPRYSSVDEDTVVAMVDGAAKWAENEAVPLYASGDREGVKLQDGNVVTPKGFKEAYQSYIQSGWSGTVGDPNYKGQGLPHSVNMLLAEIFSSANMPFSLYTGLAVGAAIALEEHADEETKKAYLPKLYEGTWSACMCLTESHAGTDLGMIHTKAVPQADGSYELSGTKIFITGGDHDMCENIVYLVLAKLPDAPPGSKGISLFLSPKFLSEEDTKAGKRNGIYCDGVEEKMGIHASATCVMRFDKAKAYLVGEVNQGLSAMFTMMNHERMMVGMQGISCAELAYQKARDYAMERRQGKAPTSDRKGSADCIVAHPDVRRMLLTQKSFIEGARAFNFYLGLQLDVAEHNPDESTRQRALNLVSLLTPVAKAFFTDKGFDCCVTAQQIFGGHGYIHESGVEQIVRDARISQIYEGTNGVQALDLVYRKVIMNNGEWMGIFVEEMNAFIQQHDSNKDMHPYLNSLKDTIATLEDLTRWIIDASLQNPDEAGAASVEYLHVVGHTAMLWMWAMQAEIALRKMAEDNKYYEAKLHLADYYIQRCLPQTEALVRSIKSTSKPLMAMPAESF